ncbi:MAG: response regulator transcription factor [Rickettsiales bacterium]
MSYKNHLLLIDEDVEFAKDIITNLEQHNYLVNFVPLYENSIDMLVYFKFELIIVNINKHNLNLIEKIKASLPYNIPIIAIMESNDTENRISILQNKADDCIIKQKDLRELILRIDFFINLYKLYEKDINIVKFGDFTFDIQRKILKKDNQIINLATSEFNLMKLLAEENKVISRDKIAKILKINTRSVDVQINRLRKKIESDETKPKFLQTIRNEGYILYY